MKSVAFAIPSVSSSVAMEFFNSARQTDWLLIANGYVPSYLTILGDQFIAKARNKLVKDFLDNQPDVENFFFLDDDLGWPAAKVLEMLERPEDIVVGVYPKKSEEPDWPVMLAGENGEIVERDGLVKVLRAPTGFMRIKRHVLETIVQQAAIFKEMGPRGEITEAPAIFFAGVMPDGWFWTEDYIFSENVQAAGFEIWADPDIAFTHRGQKAWKGTLSDAMPVFRERAAKAKKDRDAAREEFERVSAGDDVIEGELRIVNDGYDHIRSDAA